MRRRVPKTPTYQPLLFQDQVGFLLLSAVLRLQVLQPDPQGAKPDGQTRTLSRFIRPIPLPRAPRQAQSCR